LSLGVDIIPYKTCSLDCIYCQLGPSGRTQVRRCTYYGVKEVLFQVRDALATAARVDHITFSGSGEPTLNKNLGRIVRGIKKMTDIPVAVLTNGTLLTRRDVRTDLRAADVVLPSLDAVPPAVFFKVNRPHPALKAGRIVEGLARFRREFKGQIWLEVMLVRGVNDSPAHIRALARAAALIKPDRIQLNTVVRPPAVKSAAPLSRNELERVRAALGPRAEIVAAFEDRGAARRSGGLDEAIAAVVARRPVTASDLSISLGKSRGDVLKALERLCRAGRIRPVSHGQNTFFEPAL
jgi:wyosine [tRNA(Phe)-imidazoG37] synthetase (radical SAM superfamily)